MIIPIFWKNKAIEERMKNKQLKKDIRNKKRKILKELDELKEKVKDIMYIGD